MAVLWNMILCGLVGRYPNVVETCCFHVQERGSSRRFGMVYVWMRINGTDFTTEVTEASSEMWCHAVWCTGTNVLMQQIPLQHAARSSETFISVDQTVRCHITKGKAIRCNAYNKFVYKYHVLEYSEGKIVLC
jgi:hypothetical protein